MTKTEYDSKRAPVKAGVGVRSASLRAGQPERRPSKAGAVLMVLCLAVAVLCVLLVPLLLGAAPVSTTAAGSAQETVERNVTAYDGPELALAALGLNATLPTNLPEGYALTSSAVVDGKMLEIGIENGKGKLVYRAAAGAEDLAGMDYDLYAYTSTEEVDGITRGYVGVSEKKFNVAVWVNGGNSYALVSADGMDAEQLRLVAESIV